MMDEDRPMDWYVMKAMDGEGFRLFPMSGKMLKFNQTKITEEFIRHTGIKVRSSIRIPLATRPVEKGIYALLTQKIKREQA